jgi:peroxiredoxin
MKPVATIVLVFCFILACSQPNNRGFIVDVGDKAPNFETVLDNGDTFRLQNHIGKVVMLQFTASWCGVCRKEMPHIEAEIYQPLKANGLVVIGIDRDEPLETVQKFKRETNITYPLALDPGGLVFQKYALKDAGITRNIIINKQGNIAFMTRLFDKQEFEQMKEVINKLISQ